MWLKDSSIGRKLVMSISGLAISVLLDFPRMYEPCIGFL